MKAVEADAQRRFERRLGFYEEHESAREVDVFDEDHVWHYHAYGPFEGGTLRYEQIRVKRNGEWGEPESAWTVVGRTARAGADSSVAKLLQKARRLTDPAAFLEDPPGEWVRTDDEQWLKPDGDGFIVAEAFEVPAKDGTAWLATWTRVQADELDPADPDVPGLLSEYGYPCWEEFSEEYGEAARQLLAEMVAESRQIDERMTLCRAKAHAQAISEVACLVARFA